MSEQETTVVENDAQISSQWVKIGQVAQQLGISIRTIHMYEREGLFIAYKNAAGTRYFSAKDVEWLQEIRRLIKSSISIAGICRLLSLIPCWEKKHCHYNEKRGCPVIVDHKRSCWSNKENMCGVSLQECRECEVYGMRFCVGMLKHFLDIRFKPDMDIPWKNVDPQKELLPECVEGDK
ncbi:MAG: MerR family transcriptional regulator [Magnetococcus sp. DMHC-6]